MGILTKGLTVSDWTAIVRQSPEGGTVRVCMDCDPRRMLAQFVKDLARRPSHALCDSCARRRFANLPGRMN